MKGKDGIARAAYVTATGQRVVVVHVFARRRRRRRGGNRNRPAKGERGPMSPKPIPVEETAKKWMKDPEFVAAYDALEDDSLSLTRSSRRAAPPT